MQVDLGDVVLRVDVLVKGQHHPDGQRRLLWHLGPVSHTTPADRIPGPPAGPHPLRRADGFMNLKADQKVAFSLTGVDEVGNPVPLDGTTTFTVDDPALLALTTPDPATPDNPHSGVIAAVGPLGTTNLTATHTDAAGVVSTGVEAIQVVAGDAAGIAFSFGTPDEVTPDA